VLEPPPRGADARRLPIVLQARTLEGQPGLSTVAVGEVEFRRGGLVIRADRIAYDSVEDRAGARGDVRIETPAAIYTGRELDLRVQRFEGFFLDPRFELPALGAGGSATRIDFLGPGRSSALQASYTSCPGDGSDGAAEPDWVLKADRVQIDLEANEGIAEGAVLRFLGTPILALPALSFPLGDARKTGWLPPSVNIDNRSGLELSVPWYWNLAPNRDLTLAPRLATLRGLALDTEFRYLEPAHRGELRLDLLPHDRLYGGTRGALGWTHESRLPWALELGVDASRVSDREWWRDFPSRSRGPTTRLLPTRVALQRRVALGSLPAWGEPALEVLAYARLSQWQVLQDSDRSWAWARARAGRAGSSTGRPSTTASSGLRPTWPAAAASRATACTCWARWSAPGARVACGWCRGCPSTRRPTAVTRWRRPRPAAAARASCRP
jgi:LPS-assembly protein